MPWLPLHALGVSAVVVSSAGLGNVPFGAAAPKPSATENPPCIQYWPESRYRNYGYDHLVHLHSVCEATARCQVATNVSPEVYTVELPPRVEVEVLTFRGSPAREFIASVTCELPGS